MKRRGRPRSDSISDAQSDGRSTFEYAAGAKVWGKRWNRAFSELTALAVYRPLRPRWGTGRASVAAFLFSGLLHELAISLPARGGYGLPLLYFALHAVAMAMERRLNRSGRPIDRNPVLSRLWVAGWLLLPLPLLFHRPFLDGVLRPLLTFFGP